MPENDKNHWEHIYNTRQENEVSWYQAYPRISVDFIDSLQLPLNASIIDVGAGEGHLVDLLTEKGFTNIWVLDISQAAIERTKQRMGKKATGVHWIVADMLTFEPPVQFDVWHDRAAFHFLTTDEKINRYISIAEKSVKPGGHLFMGTFSELGPKKCSGLEIKQYSGGAMTKVFSPSFQNIRCVQEDHLTPFQTMQNFLFCSFIKLKHSPVI